ncbi:dehydrogenase/oxidoreductase [Aliidongia dinghuensis]|uniref:L-threonate dehydrogenase n=1 Tax=Aliidongia dinghuensis TaxID=1867774 RepID=A0A8J3E2H7_9PROT|nr:L-threonate dehydrogenase [Aliidongia dinghuensis]GGF21314.1 dehydrogenase/oxidoreductase [Aliidongia dinghuensis]
MRVGVIGLGSMGMGMALSLVRAGHEVWGSDVRPEAVESLAAAGGHGGATPAAAAEGAELVILMVVNQAQVEAVLFGPDGAAGALRPGGVVMQSATVPAGFTEALDVRLADAGLLLLDAPVSGGAAKAREGQLTIMSSGSPAAYAVADPVLAAVAATVYRLGDRPGIGSTVKTVNQLLAGVHIAAAAEAMALGTRAGADPRQLFEVISNSAGGSWMFQNRVPHMLDGDYTPLSSVEIFVKDLGLVLDTGRSLRFPLPIAAAAHQQFLAAAASGHGGEDDAAVVKVYEGLAGIKVARPKQ